eukprot:451153-Rhodomonas_salina.1
MTRVSNDRNLPAQLQWLEADSDGMVIVQGIELWEKLARSAVHGGRERHYVVEVSHAAPLSRLPRELP